MVQQVYLIRHGETAWSLSGQHTSRTDIPLIEKGENDARALAARLRPIPFATVLTSPRLRARQTCALAGLGAAAAIEPDLVEWDYGDYEGLRTAEILARRPGWELFRDGCPGGELPDEVSARADRLIARLRTMGGAIAVFSHGHFGRVLAGRWIGLTVVQSERLLLNPASLSLLSYEHNRAEEPVIALWNSASL
jgi:probable phosphoglycerate mutase